MSRAFPSVTSFVQCKYDGGAQPGPITFGVLHDAETPLEAGYAASIASYFTRNTNSTSAHFMVDPVATVQMLDTSRIGWHCGNGNTRSVGVEQAGYASFTAAQWTTAAGQQQMARVAQLMRDLHAVHGIGLFWMTDQQLRDAHAGKGTGGWATHSQCSRVLGGSTHTDPMPAYPMAQLMALTSSTPPTGGPLMALTDAEQTELLNGTRAILKELLGPDTATGVIGWPMVRPGVEDPAKPVRKTFLQFCMETWLELTQRLDLTGRPGPGKDTALGQALSARAELHAVAQSVGGLPTADAVAAAVLAKLPTTAGGAGLTEADVEAAVRSVFAQAGQATTRP